MATSSIGSLDQASTLFAQRNAQVEQELNEERQHSVAARARSLHEGKLVSPSPIRDKAVACAAAIPISSAGSRPHRILGISPSILHGALLGAIPAIAIGVIATAQANPEERAQVWRESMKQVVAALGLGGLAGYLKEAIEAKILQLADILSKKEILQSFASRASCLESGIAQVGVETLYYAVRGLWHSMCKSIAERRGDQGTVDAEQDKLNKIMNVDTACRVLAHCLAVTLGGACTTAIVARGLITGDASWYLAILVSVVSVLISDAVVEAMIAKKHAAGGWMKWLMSWILPDRRYYAWAGENFDENQDATITRELECAITHCVVVDPVRSTLSGHLYERHAIMAWLKRNGTDPVYQNERVTALDYIPAPKAKMWAHTLARELRAELVLVDV
ncbi:hypothetical protein TWF281_011398 [Arthrobotrys megalospora]